MSVRQITTLLVLGLLFLSVACGGGGGSTPTLTPTPTPVKPPPMIISTSTLPLGVQGAAYSATLLETNGIGPFAWSIDSTSLNPLPAGLSIDPGTGILSGTPATSGVFTILFKVVDSSSTPQSSTQNLTLAINSQFTLSAFPADRFTEYQTPGLPLVSVSGGVIPYTFSLLQGTLPPGVRLDPNTGMLDGAPNAVGAYTVVIGARDSYGPPESLQTSVTLSVQLPGLQINSAIGQSKLVLNKPYTGYFYGTGGTPPYLFQLTAGALPPGLQLSDPVAGLVTGTPTICGTYTFTVGVSDSTGGGIQPATFTAIVAPALGRNDTPAHPTAIGNGSIQASISPALDSTGTVAPDSDYYQVTASAGSTVHVETFAKRNNPYNPLDTVIELTDVNGGQFSTGCTQPGGTTSFTSPCLNDDISANPHIQDSSLDYKVPGTSGTQTFLIHVLDWSGNARPDMIYTLQVSGVIDSP